MMTYHTTKREQDVVLRERLRQEQLKHQGRFKHTLDEPGIPDGIKLAMILEELAEVGKNLMAREGLVQDGDPSWLAIHKELSQVAALSVAWMEGITAEIESHHEFDLESI